MYDLIAVAHAVKRAQLHAVDPETSSTPLCCFAFNVGIENFRRSSVLRRVNEGQLLQAACAMEMWRKADFRGRTDRHRRAGPPPRRGKRPCS
jgi:lysozyme